MGERIRAGVAFVVYIGAIVAANWLTARFGLVPVGFGLLVTAGTYAAGFALLARDFVQRYGGLALVLAGIAMGGALSWVTSTPRLAVASTAAFLAAELCDLVVFTAGRRRWGFVGAAAISNLASAPVDTVAFLALAGFPITWATVGGQLIGKLLWATAVPLALYVGGRYALSRDTIHPAST
jgi:hypothetical protein